MKRLAKKRFIEYLSKKSISAIPLTIKNSWTAK